MSLSKQVFCCLFLVLSLVSATANIKTILAANQYQEALTFIPSSNSVARILNDTISMYKITESISPSTKPNLKKTITFETAPSKQIIGGQLINIYDTDLVAYFINENEFEVFNTTSLAVSEAIATNLSNQYLNIFPVQGSSNQIAILGNDATKNSRQLKIIDISTSSNSVSTLVTILDPNLEKVAATSTYIGYGECLNQYTTKSTCSIKVVSTAGKLIKQIPIDNNAASIFPMNFYGKNSDLLLVVVQVAYLNYSDYYNTYFYVIDSTTGYIVSQQELQTTDNQYQRILLSANVIPSDQVTPFSVVLSFSDQILQVDLSNKSISYTTLLSATDDSDQWSVFGINAENQYLVTKYDNTVAIMTEAELSVKSPEENMPDNTVAIITEIESSITQIEETMLGNIDAIMTESGTSIQQTEENILTFLGKLKFP